MMPYKIMGFRGLESLVNGIKKVKSSLKKAVAVGAVGLGLATGMAKEARADLPRYEITGARSFGGKASTINNDGEIVGYEEIGRITQGYIPFFQKNDEATYLKLDEDFYGSAVDIDDYGRILVRGYEGYINFPHSSNLVWFKEDSFIFRPYEKPIELDFLTEDMLDTKDAGGRKIYYIVGEKYVKKYTEEGEIIEELDISEGIDVNSLRENYDIDVPDGSRPRWKANSITLKGDLRRPIVVVAGNLLIGKFRENPPYWDPYVGYPSIELYPEKEYAFVWKYQRYHKFIPNCPYGESPDCWIPLKELSFVERPTYIKDGETLYYDTSISDMNKEGICVGSYKLHSSWRAQCMVELGCKFERACMWDQNGNFIPLPPFSGYSRAFGINDEGQVVGGVIATYEGLKGAFLYQKGNLIILKDILEPWRYSVNLEIARDINNEGKICAEGTAYKSYSDWGISYGEHIFILTPKGSSPDINGDGIVNLQDLSELANHWLEEK